MGPEIIYLPDGQHFTATPVFAGLFFKSNELSTHSNAFPIGWTIVIQTEEEEEYRNGDDGEDGRPDTAQSLDSQGKPRLHSFTRPTLQGDSLFISIISNPSSQDFKPPASPTRQVAMMLWVTLYWYFHQQPPSAALTTEASRSTPQAGKPRGEWRVRIRRDGMLRGRNLLPKLERMGLIASYNSAVGTALEDGKDAWSDMFVSQQMFWQIPGRLFLFTLQPVTKHTSRSRSTSPGRSSRPGSPASQSGDRISPLQSQLLTLAADAEGWSRDMHASVTSAPPTSFPVPGPFFSGSYLPTYYPPPPLQYTMTPDHCIRHPLRPKPPAMGEVFYTRFIPSVGQYLSFRVASLSSKPVPYLGPVGPLKPPFPQGKHAHLLSLTDSALLETWFANPRVSAFWGKHDPAMLQNALQSRHSFPAIGLWDGVPFGYFELYWVKEDVLGRYAGGSDIDDWDRGCHVLIGEEWARGRVQSWLTSLVHWIFCADYRTMSVCLEPRVDNDRFIKHLEAAGFTKEKEVTFPHKQAWFGRLRRESWHGPAL